MDRHINMLSVLHEWGWEASCEAIRGAAREVGGSPEYWRLMDLHEGIGMARDIIWREYLTLAWREAIRGRV